MVLHYKIMDKLTFERNFDDIDFETGEPEKIVFEIQSDLDIWEFRTTCIRLAHSLGYQDKSIESAFGSETRNYSSEDTLDSFLREIGLLPDNDDE